MWLFFSLNFSEAQWGSITPCSCSSWWSLVLFLLMSPELFLFQNITSTTALYLPYVSVLFHHLFLPIVFSYLVVFYLWNLTYIKFVLLWIVWCYTLWIVWCLCLLFANCLCFIYLFIMIKNKKKKIYWINTFNHSVFVIFLEFAKICRPRKLSEPHNSIVVCALFVLLII